MKISTKGQYALRMMLDLAMHNSGEYIAIKSIAMRQSLPEKYLEQIMTVLSRASYVKSIRGSKGGYRLADDARKYTVGMILRTIEGSLAPVACLEEDMDPNSQNANSVTYQVWEELNDAINNVVDRITLEELVQRQMAKNGYDYMI